MIWIIGEYAERIDNADELLESVLESFPEEPAQVQLQLLTATVKLFLKKPTEGPQQMIQVVLNNATVEMDNPNLRDRAYIYWRLLSTDPRLKRLLRLVLLLLIRHGADVDIEDKEGYTVLGRATAMLQGAATSGITVRVGYFGYRV